MFNQLEQKLQHLPNTPGVYFYKDVRGQIIYVGKAINLKNRVRQYFHVSRARDAKTAVLVKEIADIDWTEVDSEIEALFLESEMIKRYQPKYNIELRDDKHYQYVRIDFKSEHPTVKIVRRPLDDGAEYFGPYVGGGVRPALRLLRKIFPFDWRQPPGRQQHHRPGLDYHLGLSPELAAGKSSLAKYRADLRKLAMYLKGQRTRLEQTIQQEMEQAARRQDFETAARKRNRLQALKNLKKQIVFSDKEIFDISKDQALNGLQQLLDLPGAPHRIEGYDISHQSGRHNTASLVVFIDGVPDKKQYRKFRLKLPGNDDFAHMREVITRRFSGKNLEQWPKPDLLLIDGGKGQVNAARQVLAERGITIPLAGLAKRREELVIPNQINGFSTVELDRSAHATKLLQRIRDESHRFAVSYHSSLKRQQNIASLLDEVPGIGPKRRQRLIKQFGTLKSIVAANQQELAAVVGRRQAEKLKQFFAAQPGAQVLDRPADDS